MRISNNRKEKESLSEMQSLSWRVNALKRRWLKAIVHKLPEGEIMKRKEEYIQALENAEETKPKNISKES